MEKVFAWTTPEDAVRDEVRYWQGCSIEERVAAVELLRRATLGIYDEPSPRLERTHRWVEPSWRSLPDREADPPIATSFKD